ncbi:hypothetical protein BLNAU_8157 [Blattamonas nauphoetae]|uniref:DOT1 domain-containing protein n=1 Tax=Blattamonas nauphoetae TaxID=2049346 RepID=A0ABQ9XZH8_9EUKA|nr:hypothetical protein BLNAU_8157 [Blattamonas nauphoetae]
MITNENRAFLVRQLHNYINNQADSLGLGSSSDLSLCHSSLRRTKKIGLKSPLSSDDSDSSDTSFIHRTPLRRLLRTAKNQRKYSRPINTSSSIDQKVGKNSIGYGELTPGSLQKLFIHLNRHQQSKFSSSSVILDIGSGLGKITYHAILTTPVRESWGVEIVETRTNHARSFGQGFIDSLRKQLDSSSNDVSDDDSEEIPTKYKRHRSSCSNKQMEIDHFPPRPLSDLTQKVRFVAQDCVTFLQEHLSTFTHLIMYDEVFSSKTYARLCPLLNNFINFNVLVSFRNTKTLGKHGLTDIVLIDSINLRTTGHQNFIAYLYVKRPGWTVRPFKVEDLDALTLESPPIHSDTPLEAVQESPIPTSSESAQQSSESPHSEIDQSSPEPNDGTATLSQLMRAQTVLYESTLPSSLTSLDSFSALSAYSSLETAVTSSSLYVPSSSSLRSESLPQSSTVQPPPSSQQHDLSQRPSLDSLMSFTPSPQSSPLRSDSVVICSPPLHNTLTPSPPPTPDHMVNRLSSLSQSENSPQSEKAAHARSITLSSDDASDTASDVETVEVFTQPSSQPRFLNFRTRSINSAMIHVRSTTHYDSYNSLSSSQSSQSQYGKLRRTISTPINSQGSMNSLSSQRLQPVG